VDEFERTYLIKTMKENIEIYLPKESVRPKIKIRKNGDQFEITKKELVNRATFPAIVQFEIVA